MDLDFEKLPKEVRITDVTLRDGLQNEKTILKTRDKLGLINDIIKTGVKFLEVTSFVRPDLVPQLADAEELFKALPSDSGCNFRALVPNIKGYYKARKAGCTDMVLFVSATEKHNRDNLGKSVDETLEGYELILAEAKKDKINVAVAVSMAFEKNAGRFQHILDFMKATDQKNVILCDTSGMADPKLVSERLVFTKKYFNEEEITLHFHDTTGCAIANVMVSLALGFKSFDAAIGGLGGCPFAEGAAGNIAMEDLLWFLHSLNINTGINIEAIIQINARLSKFLNRTLYDSKVARYFRGKSITCVQ